MNATATNHDHLRTGRTGVAASTPGRRPERRSSFARVPAAFRLQFAVPSTLIWVPLLVATLSWAIGVGILLMIDAQIDDRNPIEDPLIAPGAAQATIWCLAFMAAYAASHTFPFSMALSYSRRVYVLGAFLAFGLVSVGFGAFVALGAVVERLTDGFGRHVYVFDAPLFTDSAGILGISLLAVALCLFFMLFGFFWAVLYRRVSLVNLWVVMIGVVLVLLAWVAVVTMQEGWMSVWLWFLDQTTLTLAGWFGLGILLLAALNYGLIRKATI